MQLSTVGGKTHCETVGIQCFGELPQLRKRPAESFIRRNKGWSETNCMLEIWYRFVIAFETRQGLSYSVEALFIVGLEVAHPSKCFEGLAVHELSRVGQRQVAPCGSVQRIEL